MRPAKTLLSAVLLAGSFGITMHNIANAQASQDAEAGGLPEEAKTTDADVITAPILALKIATLLTPGENVMPGDIVHVQRPFGPWALFCDTRLTTNKRVCHLEQTIVTNDGRSALTWRLMTTVDDRTVLVFVAPKSIDREAGLRIDFGFEKTVREFGCASSCIAVIPFEGVFQKAVLEAASIAFQFKVSAGEGLPPVGIRLNGNMDGLAEAIAAANADPFGKRAQQASVMPEPDKAGAKEMPKPKTKPEARPKQPLQKPLEKTGLY